MSRERTTVGTHTGIARLACAVFAAAAASAVLGAAPTFGARTAQSTPAPASALRDITDEGSFRAAFDSAKATPRIVLLLSPT
jgi:hypothetical protein